MPQKEKELKNKKPAWKVTKTNSPFESPVLSFPTCCCCCGSPCTSYREILSKKVTAVAFINTVSKKWDKLKVPYCEACITHSVAYEGPFDGGGSVLFTLGAFISSIAVPGAFSNGFGLIWSMMAILGLTSFFLGIYAAYDVYRKRKKLKTNCTALRAAVEFQTVGGYGDFLFFNKDVAEQFAKDNRTNVSPNQN